MKSARRMLALMMCLMFAGMPMMSVFAEAGEDSIPEIMEAAPESSDVPAEVPTEERTATPTEEPTEVPTEAPAPPTAEVPAEGGEASAEATQEPAADATQEPAATPITEITAEPERMIDTTRSALFSPEFHQGYAALMGETFGYDGPFASSKAICRFASGVVLVLARDVSSGVDRLQAAFDGGESELLVWIDAASLRPMSAEETDAFVRARAAAKGTRFYLNAAELPLDVPVYALVIDTLQTVETAPEAPAVPAALMRMDEKTLTIGVGEKYDLNVGFSDGQEHAVKFTSQSSKIAAVSTTGRITGKKAGTADIRVTSDQGEERVVKVTVKKAPTSIKFALTHKTLGLDEEIELTTKLSSGAASLKLEFTNSNAAVVEIVEKDGKTYARAKDEGSATITVKTFNKKHDKVKLTVKPKPTSIALTEKELTLGVDQKYTLKAELTPGSGGGYKYYSSAPEVVAVDQISGKLTALTKGEAVITVKTYNDWTDTCAVEVKAAPKKVSLAASSISIGVGEKVALPKVTLSAGEEECAGSWSISSSNKKYVKIVSGKIAGVRRGSATVTVKTHNGKKATLKVTVKKAPSKITISAPRKTLGEGETIKLSTALSSGSASTRKYTSSDETVATVDSNGKVHALKEGSTTITVKAFNGKNASLKIKVKPEPESMTITPNAITIGLGESYTLSANVNEGSAGSYEFFSDDTDIVSVSKTTGKIKGKSVDTTKVWVRSYNGKEIACDVTVKAAPTGIFLQEKSVTLAVGDSYKLLPPTLEGDDPVSHNIKYTSSNTKYMIVSSKGKITGVKAGTATLTVSTFNGKTASIKVTVKAAPGSIAFTESKKTLFVEEEYVPTVKFSNNVAGSYSMTSSNKNAVIVAEDGLTLRAVGPGTSVITARSFNDRKAELKITVPDLPDDVKLQPSTLDLGVGETAQLTAVMPKGQGSLLDYESSDSDIASVDENGMVTAHARGSAVITVSTRNHLTSTCDVRVYDAPSGILLEPTEAEMEVGGDVLQLTATSLPDGIGAIHFASSNAKVAAVSADGIVTAKGAGTCVITATTYDGKHSAQCTLQVTSALPLAGVRIGIDPGHQGKANLDTEKSSPNGGTLKYKVSGGTTGVVTKIREYKTNLEIGLKLRDALLELGAEVVMTRKTHDVDISNQERAALMNKKNVDLALRVHCNGSENQNVNGLEIYTRKTCAYGSSEVDANALLKNEQRAAEALFDEIGAATEAKKNNIYYTDNYTMNNWSKVPCLLLELGYMTNPNEDRNLNNSAYQDKIVKGIINGICVYMGKDKIY